jgi:hypothetical protein
MRDIPGFHFYPACLLRETPNRQTFGTLTPPSPAKASLGKEELVSDAIAYTVFGIKFPFLGEPGAWLRCALLSFKSCRRRHGR